MRNRNQRDRDSLRADMRGTERIDSASAVPKSYDRYEESPTKTAGYYLAAGGLLFCAGYLFYDSLFFSLCLTLFSIPIRKYYLKEREIHRKEQLEDQFRDLLDSLASSLAAGRQMAEAIVEAEGSLRLIYDETAPIMRELSHMSLRIREGRENETAILLDFAGRSRVEDIETFAEVCGVCRSTGGNLQAVVGKASQVMRDKMAIRREIRMLTAQKRLEAKMLTAIPFLVTAFLRLTSPDYMEPLFRTGMGRMLMTVCLLGIGTAYGLSVRAARIRI